MKIQGEARTWAMVGRLVPMFRTVLDGHNSWVTSSVDVITWGLQGLNMGFPMTNQRSHMTWLDLTTSPLTFNASNDNSTFPHDFNVLNDKINILNDF